jgi:TonB-dependent SusC/RagA subfamily outer membrane receptor
MESFGIYSLKAGVVLTLFWGIYQLFMQKETFYRFNRGFLLTGLIAALLLPLITIRYTVEVSVPAVPILPLGISDMMQTVLKASTSTCATFLKYFNQLIPIVYLTVIAVILIVRFIGLTRLFHIICKNNSKRYTDYYLIESSDFTGAFSFFRFMFIPQKLNETEKHIILKHENAHIKQYHWIDLFLTNLLSLIWWFNPMMWLYGKAIRNNHEFLADQEVLTDYHPEDYRQTLINQWFKIPVYPMTNSFAYNNNLKRINMMKKNISNPLKKLFALWAIPAIAIFLVACSEKEYKLQETPNVQLSSETHKSDTIMIIGNQQRGKVEPLYMVDGKEVTNIADIDPKEIATISVLKNESSIAIYGEKGKNGVIIIKTKHHE